jgi:hypothetical protein
MITVTHSWTRPNTSAAWHQFSDEQVQYIRQNYVQTGKRLPRVVVDSQDGLTQTITVTWTDVAAYHESQQDPVLQQAWAEQTAVYNAAGIVAAPVIIA